MKNTKVTPNEMPLNLTFPKIRPNAQIKARRITACSDVCCEKMLNICSKSYLLSKITQNYKKEARKRKKKLEIREREGFWRGLEHSE